MYIYFFIDRQQRTTLLFCTDIIIQSINTTDGVKVDLDGISTNGNKSYSPQRFINLDTSTLNQPLQAAITIYDKWGTSDTCTVLIYTEGKNLSV